MPRTLPALLGPFAAFLALFALLALSLRALAALITARVLGRPTPPVASPALLAIFALAVLPHDGGRAHEDHAGPTRAAASALPRIERINRALWLALLLAALALLVLGILTHLPAATAAPIGLLALVALLHGGEHGDRAHADRADTRRGRFIPPASRLALDEMASDIRKLRLRRDGTATYPAFGRVDAALHALLGLVPYPSDPEERELLEDALRCVEVHAPEVARALGERMRAHYLNEATGGAHRAP
jgi:hypothetical protein